MVAAVAASAVRAVATDADAAGPPVKEEVDARLRAIAPVLTELVSAGAAGRVPAVSGSARLRRNVAAHSGFGEGPAVVEATTADLKRRQRGRRKGRPKDPAETSSTGLPGSSDGAKDEGSDGHDLHEGRLATGTVAACAVPPEKIKAQPDVDNGIHGIPDKANPMAASADCMCSSAEAGMEKHRSGELEAESSSSDDSLSGDDKEMGVIVGQLSALRGLGVPPTDPRMLALRDRWRAARQMARSG